MIPTNEQGTIVLFSKLADELGFKFKQIGTRCPDAILEKDGKTVRVEFEHKARTFAIHKHNPADVDLIICWQDDWPNSPLPVLSLENYVTLAHRTEEASPSLWQRLFDLCHRAMVSWIEIRKSIKVARVENDVCGLCGGSYQIKCSYPMLREQFNGDIYADGRMVRVCRQCGHTSSKYVKFYAGASFDEATV